MLVYYYDQNSDKFNVFQFLVTQWIYFTLQFWCVFKICSLWIIFYKWSYFHCTRVNWYLKGIFNDIMKAWEKWKCSLLSHVCDPWTVACLAPLSMGFSREEYWSGLPFPPPGNLPNSGIKPGSPILQADSLPSEPPEKPSILLCNYDSSYIHFSFTLRFFLVQNISLLL